MIAADIINNLLIPTYGGDRYYEVVVSEDGESDGIIEYIPASFLPAPYYNPAY